MHQSTYGQDPLAAGIFVKTRVILGYRRRNAPADANGILGIIKGSL